MRQATLYVGHARCTTEGHFAGFRLSGAQSVEQVRELKPRPLNPLIPNIVPKGSNGDRLRATSKGQLGCFVGFRESGAQPLGPGSKMIPLKPSPFPINEPAVDCVKKVWGHKMCPTTGKRSTLCPCCKGGSLCLHGRQK